MLFRSRQLREASATLSDGGSDLFSTVDSLDSFTRNLVRYDSGVRGFTTTLDSASRLLDDNRTQLTTAIRELGSALRTVGDFADRHDQRLARSVRSAAGLSTTIAEKVYTIAQILHLAPGAVIDLYLAVDNHALTGRLALGNIDSTADLVCGLILGAGGSNAMCAKALLPLLQVLGLGSVPGSAGATQGGGS